MQARLDKILRDIWDNKKRSLLVVVTLAIGIAAVGMINNTVRLVKRDLFGQFSERNPASANIYISPFPKELAQDVEALREVETAEAIRTMQAAWIQPGGKDITINLVARPTFSNLRINRLTVEQGLADPGLRGILIERSSVEPLGLQLGQQLVVKMPDGRRYNLKIEGIVHDMTQQPHSINEQMVGYVSMSTLEWMGATPGYNQITFIAAENRSDRKAVLNVATLIRDRVVEPGGYYVGAVQIPGDPDPGDFWAKRPIDGVLLVLQVMSLLAILLCAGLVVNTISAVLVQQTRQVGIMRALGATQGQVVRLYIGYVFILSVVALALALPLGLAGSYGLGMVAADFLNYNLTVVDLPPGLVLLQVAMGVIVPLGVALFPIMKSAGVSVYEAIYQSGLGGERRKNLIERLMIRFRLLSPPVMLSLRNTFRNPARLAFTLATLTIAGAMFVAVFSAYTTIQGQIDEFGRYIAFDASLSIPGGADRHTVEREAMRIPDVGFAEGWASINTVVVHPDDTESDRVELIGLPPDAQTIQPRLVAGRWLQTGDGLEAVVNEDLTSKDPSVQVGSRIQVKINGQKRQLEVVGVVSRHYLGSRIYMDYDQFTRLTGRHNQVDMVRVMATPNSYSTPNEQAAIGLQLEKRFDDAKLSEDTSHTRNEIFDAMGNAFTILLVVLLLVALILAVIGGLGLTGTMGLSVLERTREIGVLRAVGASHAAVRGVVVLEGTSVALISWVLSALASYPVARLLSQAVVRTAFGSDAPFAYSGWGLAIWLVGVILIGVLASLAPARDAVSLTVREVLNYE